MKVLQMPVRTQGTSEGAEGVLPYVWATDGNLARAVARQHGEVAEGGGGAEPGGQVEPGEPGTAPAAAVVFRKVLAPGTAFYRSYTEGMLRRYGVLSMESGRVPSMLGREMFRGRVTSYRVHGFDDVVIFCHDVERCLRELTEEQQRLIRRIGVQEYTFAEAAAMFDLTLRSVQRRYFQAVDALTSIFLKRRLLERIASDPCQEGRVSAEVVSHSPAGG